MRDKEFRRHESRKSWAEWKRILAVVQVVRGNTGPVGCNFHPMSNSYRFAAKRKSILREYRACCTQWTRWISLSLSLSLFLSQASFSSHCGTVTNERGRFRLKSYWKHRRFYWNGNNRKRDTSPFSYISRNFHYTEYIHIYISSYTMISVLTRIRCGFKAARFCWKNLLLLIEESKSFPFRADI